MAVGEAVDAGEGFQRGTLRLHILHHAVQEKIHGAWMVEELAGQGCQISLGALYPTLHWSDGLLVPEHGWSASVPAASTGPPSGGEGGAGP
ncbi:PadR family transcriptional regulator [Streptomyces sp. NPDC008092]|uniref:PadR family transcriptional regulator n=1 Tax=Streptomyces sp. NPDC008092 TaxID=3364808 RepID=UPI0036EC91F4